MRRTATAQILLVLAAVAAASCAAWATRTGIKLVMNGRIISVDVRTLDGSAYVKVSDVATALNMAISRQGDTYRLTQAGGGNQIRGVAGKMAASLFNGTWVLKVSSVQQVTGYTQRYGRDRQPLTPKEVGDTLVVVQCQIKNGTSETRDVSFETSRAGNTALTDDQQHGYVPLAYDSRNSDYSSAKMLPGSAHDFAVIFSVPEGTHLKDLIYTVLSSPADPSGEEREKGLDFRVSLTS